MYVVSTWWVCSTAKLYQWKRNTRYERRMWRSSEQNGLSESLCSLFYNNTSGWIWVTNSDASDPAGYPVDLVDQVRIRLDTRLDPSRSIWPDPSG